MYLFIPPATVGGNDESNVYVIKDNVYVFFKLTVPIERSR